MTGVIITGHGQFPSGLLSAVSLVAGKPENTEAVDFAEGMSSQELHDAINQKIDALEGDEVLVLTDLVGGTPFNQAAALKAERSDKKISVLSGTNMPGLVEAVFSRSMYSLEQLAEAAANACREGVVNLEALSSAADEPEFEDGL